MTSLELERLAEIGALRREPPSRRKLEGWVRSVRARLLDAAGADLAIGSQVDLVYNASHALASAALRQLGYRSGNRHLVF